MGAYDKVLISVQGFVKRKTGYHNMYGNIETGIRIGAFENVGAPATDGMGRKVRGS